MIKQAIEQGEVDPGVDVELAIMVMEYGLRKTESEFVASTQVNYYTNTKGTK